MSNAERPVPQLQMLLMRNLRESLRNPLMAFGLPVAVPIVALLLVATTLLQVTYLPGFPTNNYAEWLTPPAIMCTAMSAAGYTATSLVIDIQSGFLDRLRLLDARPRAVIVSRVLFDVLRVVPSGAAVLIVGVLLGTRVNEGVMGIVALFALLVLWTVAYGGLFFVVALRTRNPLAPIALLPIAIPMQFLSTQYAPRSLLPSWVGTVSNWNPFSYMADASRALLSGPFSVEVVARAAAVGSVLLVITMVASLRAFSHAVDPG